MSNNQSALVAVCRQLSAILMYARCAPSRCPFGLKLLQCLREAGSHPSRHVVTVPSACAQAAAQRTVARSTGEVWAKAWAMAQHMVVQKKMEQEQPRTWGAAGAQGPAAAAAGPSGQAPAERQVSPPTTVSPTAAAPAGTPVQLPPLRPPAVVTGAPAQLNQQQLQQQQQQQQQLQGQQTVVVVAAGAPSPPQPQPAAVLPPVAVPSPQAPQPVLSPGLLQQMNEPLLKLITGCMSLLMVVQQVRDPEPYATVTPTPGSPLQQSSQSCKTSPSCSCLLYNGPLCPRLDCVPSACLFRSGP